MHGCLAGKYDQSIIDILIKRIWRNNEHYSLHKLGAYSQGLMILAVFFPLNWSEPIQIGLSEEKQAWLLNSASFHLMSLGRFQEAIEPMLACLKFSERQENWRLAASILRNLVSLYQILGQLKLAHSAAQQTIKYEDIRGTFTSSLMYYSKTNEDSESLTCLATILHCNGNLNEAKKYFLEAESLEQIRGLKVSSFTGFRYCALLLDTNNDKTTLQKVEKRAEDSLDVSTNVNHLYHISLSNLTLARIHAIFGDQFKAEKNFQHAIQIIQKANVTNETPSFYLYRADFYLAQNQLDPAQADLNSAWEIIERCGMKLYAVDYLLIHGRYSLATADFDTALKHYEEAKQLIQETGYHLRDAELDLFAAQLCQQQGDVEGKNAVHYLQKAKNRIEEIGQWGLMPRWEKTADLMH